MCIEALQAADVERPDIAPTPGTATSRDGTTIAFEHLGEGPALVLVEGALLHRRVDPKGAKLAGMLAGTFTVFRYDRRGRGGSGDRPPHSIAREIEDLDAVITAAGGAAFVYGRSSGAVLALDAARHLPSIGKLALYEPPFIVDDSRANLPTDYLPELNELVAAGRRGDAVQLFLTAVVGVSDDAVASLRTGAKWPALETVAHTLTYDYTIMAGTQMGKPLPPRRWKSVDTPTLILNTDGGELFLKTGIQALARLLRHARRQVLQHRDDHTIAVKELASEIQDFFTDRGRD